MTSYLRRMSAIALLLPLGALAQSAPLDDQAIKKEMEKLYVRGHADDFRKHSIPFRTETTTPVQRSARDAYWDMHLPHPVAGQLRSPGANGLPRTEFPTVNGQAWVVATIRDYSMYALRNRKGAYTEFTSYVSQVLRNESASTLGPGSILELAEPGGTLKEQEGDKSYFLSEVDYPLQVSHQYLLQLTYNETGNFWLVGFKWDFSSGYAIPDDPYSMAFYGRHLSSITGLKADDAISVATKSISQLRSLK